MQATYDRSVFKTCMRHAELSSITFDMRIVKVLYRLQAEKKPLLVKRMHNYHNLKLRLPIVGFIWFEALND